jgi:predicted enzyme related to lactoylglutathione lyase
VKKRAFVTTLLTLVSGFGILVVLGKPMIPTSVEAMAEGKGITEQVVFLYYSDLEAAANFYGNIMGFRETYSLDWVKIYETTQGASIGIVDEKKGFLEAAKDKPVMLSWVTDDVDGWYRYVKGKGVEIQTEPKDTEETGIRSFIFSDPGGYTLEFFAWTR